MKALRKIISFTLCAAMLIGMAALTPFSASAAENYSFETAQAIALNEVKTAEITAPAEMAYYSFTPENSYVYEFTSTSEEDVDTYGYIYDSNGVQIASDDDSGADLNFSVSCPFTAGETYYFVAKFLNSGRVGSFPVTVREYEGIYVQENNINVAVAPGEKAELSFNAAVNSGELSYEWFLIDSDGYNESTGETGSTFVTDEINYYTRYRCEVTCGIYSRSVYFYVKVDSGLKASMAGGYSDRYVPFGETETLEVEASADYGAVCFQWYKNVRVVGEDGETAYYDTVKVDGATDCYLVTDPVETYTYYYCVVTDDFGNDTSCYFYLYVDSELKASPDGEENISVPYGEKADLAVKASVAIGSVSYKWEKRVSKLNENGVFEWEYTTLTEETGNSLTTDEITSSTRYVCTVYDDYGRSTSCWFYIEVENGFSAQPVGNENMYIAPGGSVQMEVDASADVGELTYRWYKNYRVKNAENEYEWYTVSVQGANGPVLSVDDINERVNYYCEVYDIYGNSASVYFYIYIDNNFYTERVGESSRYVAPGASETFEVNVSVNTGSVRYQWYKETRVKEDDGYYWDSEIIPGATSNTFTAEDITNRTNYCCRVSDDYGNSDTLWFYVYIENNFHAEAVGDTSRYVAPGGSETFEVEASADSGNIHYQWYVEKRISDGDGSYSWEESVLEGETSSSITVDDINENAHYYCDVSDDYGSSTSIWFYVYIENSFTAERVGEYDRYVAPGGSETLEVEASVSRGGVHYQWAVEYRVLSENGHIQWVSEDLEGETSSTLVLNNIDRNAEYFCRVSDDYGSSTNVWFYVHIDNGFNVESVGATNRSVRPGATETLKVNASADQGQLTYQWYYERRVMTEDGDYTWKSGVIPGATEDTYVIESADVSSEYYCVVTDDYGNSNEIWYYVGIDSGMTVNTESDVEVYVPEGQTAELTVDAAVYYGSLSYYWYVYNEDQYEWISCEEHGDTITTVPINDSTRYYCRIYDDYGNVEYINFFVYVDSGLKVNTPYENRIFVPAGTKTTLSVDAEITNGDIHYRWGCDRIVYNEEYDYWDWVYVGVDSEEGSVTTDEINTYSEYYCYITDDYGNEQTVIFFVAVDSGFTVETPEQVNLNVSNGENVVLTVEAYADEGVELTYYWYDSYHIDSYDSTGNTLDLGNVTRSLSPVCRVNDPYGNMKYVRFFVNVSSDPAVHEFGEPDWIWASDNSSAQAYFPCEDEPNSSATVKATLSSEETLPTCTEPGRTVYTATVTFDGETYTTSKTVAVNATGHSYGEWTKLDGNQHQRVCANDPNHVEKFPHSWNSGVITTAPTCAKEGVKTYTCTVCSATKTEAVAKTTEHKWNAGVITTAPTLTKDGVRTYTCTVCSATKTEAVPKTAPTGFMLGDMNLDKAITAEDARLALRQAVKLEHFAESSANYINGDVNFDGKITADDARSILRAAVKLESPSDWLKNMPK
ncbi:MAG: dockerin type I repeat-containing protein [Clostridia bacterium]|nr:dockerin type I repeat-containing protein [Clostridia bacterium]